MGSDKHCASMLLPECVKGIGDFILFACAFDLNFYAECTRRIVQILQLIVEERIVGVQKHTNQLNLWSELMQEAKPLALHLVRKKAHPGQVATGTI